MHDPIGMHASNSWCNLIEHIAGFLLWEKMFLDDDVEQLFTIAELSDDIDELCLLEYLVYF
jgi:hypothetical protein